MEQLLIQTHLANFGNTRCNKKEIVILETNILHLIDLVAASRIAKLVLTSSECSISLMSHLPFKFQMCSLHLPLHNIIPQGSFGGKAEDCKHGLFIIVLFMCVAPQRISYFCSRPKFSIFKAKDSKFVVKSKLSLSIFPVLKDFLFLSKAQFVRIKKANWW